MVQVLPYVPTFLEKLTPYLQQAAGDITQGIEQRSAMKSLEKYYKQRTGEGITPEGGQEAEQGAPSIGEAIQVSKLAEKALGKERSKELLSHELSQMREIDAEKRKEKAALKKETAQKKEYQGSFQNAFNSAASLLAKNAPGVGISASTKLGINREGVANRAFLRTLKGKFESILLPLESKGALSKPRFDFIISQIPDPGDSQQVFAGKLKGLAEALGQEGFPIDTKILDSIPWFSQSLKELGNESAQERPPLESFYK